MQGQGPVGSLSDRPLLFFPAPRRPRRTTDASLYRGDMTDRRLAVQAWESLFRAQHEVFEELRSDFEGTDLTQAEYDVLLTVTRAPEMTARLRDVTGNMLISQPSVSRLVERMVARDLLTKCADPEDGRGSLVTATEAGAVMFRKIAAAHGRSIADRMARLDDDELAQLHALTAKLRGER
ncbi:DNA-binding MarR family transcriptional regulator [Microbacterium testaceum]|nr:DNA-binding MarR family transcriptional regulator [Microbacterium sp. SORGH_AS_0969]MDQ1115959.1 DNA-binding MarR family transcriptional regulator [Microbacterium testaceum]